MVEAGRVKAIKPSGVDIRDYQPLDSTLPDVMALKRKLESLGEGGKHDGIDHDELPVELRDRLTEDGRVFLAISRQTGNVTRLDAVEKQPDTVIDKASTTSGTYHTGVSGYEYLEPPKWKSPSEEKEDREAIRYSLVREVLREGVDFKESRMVLARGGFRESYLDHSNGTLAKFMMDQTEDLSDAECRRFIVQVTEPLLHKVADNTVQRKYWDDQQKRKLGPEEYDRVKFLQTPDDVIGGVQKLFGQDIKKLPLLKRISAWTVVTSHLDGDVDLKNEKSAEVFKATVDRSLKAFGYKQG